MEDTAAPDKERCIKAEIPQLSEQNRHLVLAVELALFFGQNSQVANEENKGDKVL
ncbi:hypothetical protein FACS189494_08410 [Spirochaetia bacterium]|nr:hypothetical protein FACS189494_08410 [Spirochaetia bacterium]